MNGRVAFVERDQTDHTPRPQPTTPRRNPKGEGQERRRGRGDGRLRLSAGPRRLLVASTSPLRGINMCECHRYRVVLAEKHETCAPHGERKAAIETLTSSSDQPMVET